MGVDAIEFDIWLSKDGIPVLVHDENAYRVSRVDKKLGEMALEEIKELSSISRRSITEEPWGIRISR